MTTLHNVIEWCFAVLLSGAHDYDTRAVVLHWGAGSSIHLNSSASFPNPMFPSLSLPPFPVIVHFPIKVEGIESAKIKKT